MFNNDQAFREGWGLFERDDGVIAIQRLDDPRSVGDHYPEEPPFQTDAQAHYFVECEAKRGSVYHATAVAKETGEAE